MGKLFWRNNDTKEIFEKNLKLENRINYLDE